MKGCDAARKPLTPAEVDLVRTTEFASDVHYKDGDGNL